MIEIQEVLVSLNVIDKKFLCDLHSCHGACCEGGDSGAPLEDDEIAYLEDNFDKIKPFLREEGIKAIEEQGTWVIDVEHDKVTPLRDGKECAYTIYEKGIATCGIEKAFEAGAIEFQKPVSCHLYPIRIKKYRDFTAVNYDSWDLCKPALIMGDKLGVRVYQFLKEPLIRKFGENWYNELSFVAEEYLKFQKDKK